MGRIFACQSVRESGSAARAVVARRRRKTGLGNMAAILGTAARRR
jgi:hypothetical protein